MNNGTVGGYGSDIHNIKIIGLSRPCTGGLADQPRGGDGLSPDRSGERHGRRSVSGMFQPCLRAVAGTVLMMVWLIAPSMLLWHPGILCFTLSIPGSNFAMLFVA
ncbi:MAG: hypothetical protein OXC57_10350 [Rhodobacteraceae bacterium]|nr:hypothetical protein [Paracoccaceae bacterium]